MVSRLLGGAIDPPNPQGRTRPYGVYSYPDPRYSGRTIFEAWDGRGVCLSIASLENSTVHGRTEADFWTWLDRNTDLAAAVNETARRRPTRHLRGL